MKRGFLIVVALVVLLLFSMPALAGEPQNATPENMETVPWLSYTIGVSLVRDRPLHVTGNPEPVGERFMLVKIVCIDGTMAIRDIVENIETFYIEDPEENTYVAGAFLPLEIVYIQRNGVFSTAMAQSSFELLFQVPEQYELKDLALLVEKELGGRGKYIELGDVPQG